MPKRNKISHAQQALPFTGTSRLVAEPLRREWLFVTSAGACVLVAALCYGYLVVHSIAEATGRESALKESRALAAERATLEGDYFEKTRGITLTYARALGYRESQDKVFVARTEALSYRE